MFFQYSRVVMGVVVFSFQLVVYVFAYQVEVSFFC
jgi:hypothetical protein